MSKVVRAVVGAALLIGAVVATGGLALAFTAGGLATAAATFGASLLLGAAAEAMMPKPQLGQFELNGRMVSVREPVMPRQLVYGRARKGGVIAFLHSTGSSNETIHLVIVLAAHQVQKIGAVFFNGEMAVDENGAAVGEYASLVHCEKRLGDLNQTAFDGLVSAAPDKWTAAHKLTGCAAIYVRLTHNANTFRSGIPNITVDVEGKNDILDPRTGQRGYSENPALCLADYMCLEKFGLGQTIGVDGGVDTATLIESANICDESVALSSGGSEKRYTLNGVVSLEKTPQSIIQSMLTAMAGECVQHSGRWRIHAGAYRAPTKTLTADDAREGGMVLTTRRSRANLFNAVRGKFVSPENDWQPDDFPAYRSSVYRAEDRGEEIWKDISLPFTISSTMAQRLAKIELERCRRQMTVGMKAKLSAIRVAAGENVYLKYDRWGFSGDGLPNGKPFKVKSFELSVQEGNGGPVLVPDLLLEEESPEVYNWSASEAQVYAAAPRTSLPKVTEGLLMGAPSGQEAKYETRGGLAKLLLRVSWTASPSAYVSQYQVSARLNGGEWKDYGQTTDTFFEILDVAKGNWDFKVRAITRTGVTSAYLEGRYEVTGVTPPPSALRNVSLQSAGGMAVIKWDRVADIDVRIGGSILVRHSSDLNGTWPNSVHMDKIAGDQAIAVVPLKPGTYLLRAEDSESRAGPISSVTTKGVQILPFSTLNSLIEDTGFNGAKTNVVAETGILQLPSQPDTEGNVYTTVDSGVYEFTQTLDFGSLKRVRLRSEIAVAASALNDKIDSRTTKIDEWLDFDGSAGAEVDVVVEVRETDDDPNGTPTWGPWGRVDNHEIEARGVQARATLSTKDRAFSPAVSKLRLIADEVQ